MAHTMDESRNRKREKVLQAQRRVGAVPSKSKMVSFTALAIAATFLIVSILISALGH